MRFLANGPSIPDELLVARDEGRVVFFCGAGVSLARAGLPDFFGLTRKVIETLGVTSDNPAKRILDEARDIETRTGVSGLISADKVFGLLERDFLATDIESSVAKVLKPSPAADVSAHRIILDLAKGPDGKTRLVTTNFDLLFESCDSNLRSWKPPSLPNPQNHDELAGVIHLHGCVDENYSRADGDGFVLSSSEFGRAYLSDGWATQFIRTILDRYFVVFIGYTADDPPVQYLLEALNRSLGSRDGLYAFQSGASRDAESRWRHKGVQPIEYDEGENHRVLWDTLGSWAVRAQNPEAWHENVIALAQRGPEALLPYERGQIAHIVSTFVGIKKFVGAAEPPPANWLCVFDPLVRYSKPGRIWDLNSQGPFFDPFEAYCLDSDPVPSKIDPDEFYSKREVPDNVWDCFAAARLDRQNLRDDSFAALRGHWASHVPRLPSRLAQLGIWIAKVSNQPAAVWWASGQSGIHPDIQFDIQFQLELGKIPCSTPVRQAWRYIFEASEDQKNVFNLDLHELKAGIGLDGWTSAAVRKLALIHRPYLTAERDWSKPKPPGNQEGLRIQDLVKLAVKYPNPTNEVEIPDEFLHVSIREFRNNLEHAVSLEKELGGYRLESLVSLEPDSDRKGDSIERTHGISVALLFYVGLFKRLIDKDLPNAKMEALAWPTNDETVFARLRIWVCGDQRIFSGSDAGRLLCSMSDRTFWNSRHQRDLLPAIAKRWSDFPPKEQTELEERLLQGPSRWDEEEEAEFIERRAWLSLTKIHWLKSHGCEFQFDFDAVSSKLRQHAPKWQTQYAENAAASMEGRGGWVKTNTEYAVLLTVPLVSLLDKAKELSGRTDDILVERDPYAGLSSQRPVRAFAALIKSAKLKKYPEWAWRTFLNADARKADKPKLSALIAERVSRLPANTLAQIIHPICDWFLVSSGILLQQFPEQFERVWAKIIAVLNSEPTSANTSVLRGSREPDWAMEALNSPVGKLSQALMNDPQTNGLKAGNGFPRPWITRVNELFLLEGDRRRHALVILSYRLNWLFAIDSAWTESNLLSVLDVEGDDQSAVWAGFFWRAEIPNQELFLRLKPWLLKLAQHNVLPRRNHGEVLAGILLAGWVSENAVTGERCVSDMEVRHALVTADEDFRLHALWQLNRWCAGDEERSVKWAKELPIFLTDAWPRQISAKSSRITAALCDLAISDMAKFPERVDFILPLVTTLDHRYLGFHQLEAGIVDKCPEKVLELLVKVLPQDVVMWPYGIAAILEPIGNADPTLLRDPRLVELQRRWNAR
jgi:hypothetical protein